MSINHRQIEEGINYLRTITQAEYRGEIIRPEDIAEDLGIPARDIKDAIHAAKPHNEQASKIPDVKLKQPYVKIHRELMTGHKQVLKAIDVEFLKEIVVKYEDAEVTEFTTLLPVEITVRRV